jgi:hypothetical protein
MPISSHLPAASTPVVLALAVLVRGRRTPIRLGICFGSEHVVRRRREIETESLSTYLAAPFVQSRTIKCPAFGVRLQRVVLN